MRLAVADELEEFVRRGALWDQPQLDVLIASLEAEAADRGDAVAGLLTQPLRSIGLRCQRGEVPRRLAGDVEGIVYPRLWKIMEGIRDEMPDGELRTRIEVFNRRLARRFADETGDGTGDGPQPPGGPSVSGPVR